MAAAAAAAEAASAAAAAAPDVVYIVGSWHSGNANDQPRRNICSRAVGGKGSGRGGGSRGGGSGGCLAVFDTRCQLLLQRRFARHAPRSALRSAELRCLQRLCKRCLLQISERRAHTNCCRVRPRSLACLQLRLQQIQPCRQLRLGRTCFRSCCYRSCRCRRCDGGVGLGSRGATPPDHDVLDVLELDCEPCCSGGALP